MKTFLSLFVFVVQVLTKRFPVEIDSEKIAQLKFDEDVPSLILFYDRTNNHFE